MSTLNALRIYLDSLEKHSTEELQAWRNMQDFATKKSGYLNQLMRFAKDSKMKLAQSQEPLSGSALLNEIRFQKNLDTSAKKLESEVQYHTESARVQLEKFHNAKRAEKPVQTMIANTEATRLQQEAKREQVVNDAAATTRHNAKRSGFFSANDVAPKNSALPSDDSARLIMKFFDAARDVMQKNTPPKNTVVKTIPVEKNLESPLDGQTQFENNSTRGLK